MTSTFPENPVLVRAWRGGAIESQHRGAWALVDASGATLDGAVLLRANLREAVADEDTRWPENFSPNFAGVIFEN